MRRIGAILVMTLAWCGAYRALNVSAQPKSGADDPSRRVGEVFKLPNDAGGKLLAEVLPPKNRPGAMDNPTRSVSPFVPTPRLTALEPSLPEMPFPTPRLPKLARSPRPHTVTEERLDEGFSAPALPSLPSFRPGVLTREVSESVHIPPPLPYLVLPPVDRVPLDDPTQEASTAAVLVAPLPERTTPLAFTRLSVPEPFEWRGLTMPPLPEELTTPIGPTPTKP